MSEQKHQEDIKSMIGGMIHTGLRKYAESPESNTAWHAIKAMPNEEWSGIARAAAEQVEKLYRDAGYLSPEEALELGCRKSEEVCESCELSWRAEMAEAVKAEREALLLACEWIDNYWGECPLGQCDWARPDKLCETSCRDDDPWECWAEYFKSQVGQELEG